MRRKKSFSKKMKKRALHRANHRCEICSCHVSMTTAEAHHIKPVSQGGQNSAINLQIVCRPCHLKIHQKMDRKKTIKVRNAQNSQTNFNLITNNLKATFTGLSDFLEELEKIAQLTKEAVINLSNSLGG